MVGYEVSYTKLISFYTVNWKLRVTNQCEHIPFLIYVVSMIQKELEAETDHIIIIIAQKNHIIIKK